MSDDVKTAVGGVMTAFEEFKSTNDARLKEIEKRGAASAETEAKLARIEADIAKHEGVSAKLLAAETEAKAAKAAADEAKAALDKVEAKLARVGTSRAAADPAELKARVNVWARGVIGAALVGEGNLPEEQRKALAEAKAEYKSLSVADDTTGGYLAPSEYVKEIIRSVTLMSPARQLVSVRTTGAKSILLPKRTGQFAATRVAEQGTRSETTGLLFGMVEITAPEMYALVDISQQNLEDSAFDLEAELSFEATEQFAVKEGAEFVSGSGVGAMEGILTNTSVASTVSGSATTVADANGQADGILTLKHAIKSAYARNATWAMNRTTLGSVRKLKDTNKQYIWMPGIQNGAPNTIDGDPYVEVPDMPSEGAGLYPIAYGDFKRAYVLLDRVSMTLLRDQFTQATSGNIRFLFRRRVGGAVVLAEAIRLLKCST